MRQALVLARRARGNTWPNPMVGAVVVRRGRVVGKGFHRRVGLAHAEVEALLDAGERARGADLYVTLEPCHCLGRTPPCTDRVISSGVRRVFVGACDPNPRECGAGLDVLGAAGIQVYQGVLEAECLLLNEVFQVLITEGRPFVTVKAAASLDGRLAPYSGDARWISSKPSRVHAHRLRARNQAIMVGSGTVAQDDPALNLRHVRGRDPFVVVVDTGLKISPRALLIRLERKARVLIYCSRRAPADRVRVLEAAGATIVRTKSKSGRLDLSALLVDLLGKGLHTVLVEGGGKLIGSLFAEHLVDRLELAQAPLLLGSGGVPLMDWKGPARVADAPRLEGLRRTRRGPDLHLSGRVVWPK